MQILLFIFCALFILLESTAKDKALTDDSVEAYNFTDEQMVYILKTKLLHKDEILALTKNASEAMGRKDDEILALTKNASEAMGRKDDEILALTKNASEWRPLVKAYYTYWCGNQFREAVSHIENDFVTNIGFISTYSSFNATILSCIDDFNLIRKQKGSTAIDKAKLEKPGDQVSVKKTTFSRQEKWYLLATWFLELKKQPNELQRLKCQHPELFDFRETFLHEFQNGTLQTPDKLLAIVTSNLFAKTWDLVTFRVVKRLDKPMALEQLRAVIDSLPDLKKDGSICVHMIVKEPRFIL